MKVSQIMRQPVISLREDDSLEEAARVMLEHDLRGVPVVNDRGQVTGFLSVSDFLAKDKCFPFSRFYAPQLFGKWIPKEGIERIYEEARSTPVKEVMSTGVVSVSEDATLEEVVELMLRRDLHRIPVMRDGVPVGIVARYDLLKMMMQEGKLKEL